MKFSMPGKVSERPPNYLQKIMGRKNASSQTYVVMSIKSGLLEKNWCAESVVKKIILLSKWNLFMCYYKYTLFSMTEEHIFLNAYS